MSPIDHLTEENFRLLSLAREWKDTVRVDPARSRWAILRPCRIKVLLVADGGLDFSLEPFGLRTFVETLLSQGGPARFEITLAHIDAVTDEEVMRGDPRIARSIKQIRFDDPAHFPPGEYDQVWLFGIATSYSRGNDANNVPYPRFRLSDAELLALHRFMEGGGGLFATGDHGILGVCLGGSVPRARSMRLWRNTSGNDDVNEVSMNGPRRNDTNRLGHDTGSEFNDQSDDIPQTIQPKMYTRWGSLLRVGYPHPLLCGRKGIIRVLPDHPHEGECIEPVNPDAPLEIGGVQIVEYPLGPNGSRPLPEVIATSSVLGNTVSGTKSPTEAHTFGSICAYDGHRVGIGRVVTDATWHHFVNVNLIGDPSAPEADPKKLGFLATPQGQAHLEEIKTYYRNIAFWLARPESILCINRQICWELLWHHRVLEAVMTRPDIPLGEAPIRLLYDIGRHARDVLGKIAGRCLSWKLALDLASPFLPDPLRPRLDPWAPVEEDGGPPEPDLPWFDPEPLLDTALGGALLAMREEIETPPSEERLAAFAAAPEALGDMASRGAEVALRASMRSLAEFGGQSVEFLLTGVIRKKDEEAQTP